MLFRPRRRPRLVHPQGRPAGRRPLAMKQCGAARRVKRTTRKLTGAARRARATHQPSVRAFERSSVPTLRYARRHAPSSARLRPERADARARLQTEQRSPRASWAVRSPARSRATLVRPARAPIVIRHVEPVVARARAWGWRGRGAHAAWPRQGPPPVGWGQAGAQTAEASALLADVQAMRGPAPPADVVRLLPSLPGSGC
jgi:hypothetical protein